jgi:hypothetical protein
MATFGPTNGEHLSLVDRPLSRSHVSFSYQGVTFACLLLLGQGLGTAQGTVDFNNNVSFATSADRLVRDVSGMPLVGTNYLTQLYYGTPGSAEGSLVPVMSPPARFRSATTSFPGTWSGGTRTLQGFLAGNEVSLQVRVWDSAASATWEQAAAIGFDGTEYGVSGVFSYVVPPGGPQGLFYIENFRGFTLVPEPSIALLGIVGIVGLYFWRRGRTQEGRNAAGLTAEG